MPLFGGLAEQTDRFGLVFRHAIAAEEQHGEPVLGFAMPLPGGLAEPAGRFSLVLRHALAFKTGIGPGEHLLLRQRILRHLLFELFQDVLRLGIALPGGIMQPAHRLFPVLRGPFPFGVQRTQGKPGSDMALRGGLAQPGKPPFPVPHDAFTVEEHFPHLMLSRGAARPGRLEIMGKRGAQVSVHAQSVIEGVPLGERLRNVVFELEGFQGRVLFASHEEVVEHPLRVGIGEQEHELN